MKRRTLTAAARQRRALARISTAHRGGAAVSGRFRAVLAFSERAASDERERTLDRHRRLRGPRPTRLCISSAGSRRRRRTSKRRSARCSRACCCRRRGLRPAPRAALKAIRSELSSASACKRWQQRRHRRRSPPTTAKSTSLSLPNGSALRRGALGARASRACKRVAAAALSHVLTSM